MLNELVKEINSQVSGANAVAFIPEDTKKLDGSITVEAGKLRDVVKVIKKSFNALQVISGVDYVDYIEVCYMFCNFDPSNPRDLTLKVKVTDRVNGEVDSICDLYPAANYQERECFDMLGVTFKNHPDHRRILCPDDWQGFPLRKDYVAQKYYRGMEVYPDSKMNMNDREFIVRQEMIKKAQAQTSTPQ